MTQQAPVVYSLPLSEQLASSPPPNDASASVKTILSSIFSQFTLVKTLFVRYCGVSNMPVAMWPQLSGVANTLKSGNLSRLYVQASENIAYGNLISLWLNAGILQVRNAKADVAGKFCDGFCSTPGGITSGTVGELMLRRGLISNLSGLTIGQRYWLSATVLGGFQNTAPVAAGNVEQYLGMAMSTTELYIDTNYWIQH